MAGFQQAEREHRSALAAVEKRALIWMAERLPPWVNSDHLTALGFMALLAVGACYWWSRHWTGALVLANVAFLLNWFGDSLDGTLARVRGKQRPRYGFYVDHVLDACGSLFIFGGLALSGYMSERVAVGLLVAWFLLSIETYLATYTLGRFELSAAFFGPTELRLLLIAGNFALMFHPIALIFGRPFLLFDVGGVIGIAGMTAALVTAIVRHTAFLYRAETLH
ncbi:MAG TPA: CDP-alcohol phosphatidyltransferase family protein [Bryobacteraceae bacterium]|nr:CDP-alcohol phosphatidyltransferase family protein [Bryobacteraceae bacterium]